MGAVFWGVLVSLPDPNAFHRKQARHVYLSKQRIPHNNDWSSPSHRSSNQTVGASVDRSEPRRQTWIEWLVRLGRNRLPDPFRFARLRFTHSVPLRPWSLVELHRSVHHCHGWVPRGEFLF